MKTKFTTRLKSCWCFALAPFFVWPCSAVAIVQGAPEKEQIQRIESKLTEEARKLNAFQSKEKRLLTLLAELEQEVADTKKEMEGLAFNIRHVRERMTEQKEKLKNLKTVLRGTEVKICEYLIALYKYTRRGNAGILTNVSELNELRRRVKYIKVVTEKDREQLLGLTEQALKYHAEMTKTEKAIGEAERVGRERESRLAFLQKELEKKVFLLMKIHEEKEFYETSVQELEIAVEDLKRPLDPIEPRNPYEIDPLLRFEDCKGQLPLPIRGKLVKRRAKMGGALSNSKGVVIEADSDLAVRSVFPGKVAYSGSLKGYGEVVILSHGGRFFTVSAHLSKRKKAKGDRVQGGEILGWIEGNGSLKGPIVYFEVRRADRQLDPLQWLKAD